LSENAYVVCSLRMTDAWHHAWPLIPMRMMTGRMVNMSRLILQ